MVDIYVLVGFETSRETHLPMLADCLFYGGVERKKLEGRSHVTYLSDASSGYIRKRKMPPKVENLCTANFTCYAVSETYHVLLNSQKGLSVAIYICIGRISPHVRRETSSTS